MNSKKIVIISSIVFVALAALIVILNKAGQTNEEKQTAGHPPIENQPTIGEADAPVSIVEFGDYKCPSCKSWGESVYKQLEADYIDTGKAKFSYINVLFHGNESVLASLAAESVYKQDPDSFWDFHNALFADQPTSQKHDEAWVTPEKLLEIAEGSVANIDIEQLEKDIVEGGTIEEVKLDDELVKKFGIQFTPTVIIDGFLIKDPFDYKAISAFIDKRLEDGK